MYKLEFSERFLKGLRKIDPSNRRILAEWVDKNLVGTNDPREFGKPLKGQLRGLWRYRIGQYRILAHIVDGKLLLLLLDVDHRKNIYR
jgi:mRNA interferase RelE/StbE